ncbi:MAG: DUF123 domain-containing protein [Nanoarchaeota archaeon]|nr:DUF123 domain-containing protein [Nanoarchaeota archaeon]
MLEFEKGNYIYIGSAQNNLEKRIQRHLSAKKKLRWHVDYVLNSKDAYVAKAFYKTAPKKEECSTAGLMMEHGVSIEGFGCSDCRCSSHFFRIKMERVQLLEKHGFIEFKKNKLR